MKIGCLTSSISYTGGWDTLSKGIIGEVAKYHDVTVLTARGTHNDISPYPIYSVLPSKYISFGLINQFKVFFQCLKYFKESDVIHVFIEPFAPGAALASKFLDIPLLITLAGTYSAIPKNGGFRGFIKRTLMKFMYRQASFIATGSYKNIELIEEVMPLGNKWQFIPFGVDLQKFRKTKNYIKPEHPFIFTVGAVKERKGADYVLKALALIKDDFPDLHYKIAGDDTQKPFFVAKLKKLIKDNGLEERVELLGRISDEKLFEYYATCEVFVLAAQNINNTFEGFPMVFYEAHSLGAPIISTRGFGSEYVIKNGYNGFLVPQGDYIELSESIKKIVGNYSLRNQMSQNGQKEAAKHSWKEIVKNYLSAYRLVTANA